MVTRSVGHSLAYEHSVCLWVTVLSVTVDPHQSGRRGAEERWQPAGRGWAAGRSLLHFFGRNLSGIYLLPLMIPCPE